MFVLLYHLVDYCKVYTSLGKFSDTILQLSHDLNYFPLVLHKKEVFKTNSTCICTGSAALKKYCIRCLEDTNQNWNLTQIRERTYICTSIIKVRVKTIIKVVQIKCPENQKREICNNKPSTQLVIQRNISEYIVCIFKDE